MNKFNKYIVIRFICQSLKLEYYDELIYDLKIDKRGSDLIYNGKKSFMVTPVLNEKLNQKMLDLFNYFDITYNTSPAPTIMIQITESVIMIFVESVNSGSILYNTIYRKLYE